MQLLATIWLISVAVSSPFGVKEYTLHQVQFETETDCLTSAGKWGPGLTDGAYTKGNKVDYELKETRLAPKDATMSYSCKETEKK